MQSLEFQRNKRSHPFFTSFSFYPSSIPGEFLIGQSLMEAQEFGRSERGKDLNEEKIRKRSGLFEPFNCTIALKKEILILNVERC